MFVDFQPSPMGWAEESRAFGPENPRPNIRDTSGFARHATAVTTNGTLFRPGACVALSGKNERCYGSTRIADPNCGHEAGGLECA